MKIKLPKPISRDPNALDARSRKSAGPFRSKKPRQKVKLTDFDDELEDEKYAVKIGKISKDDFSQY